MLSSLYLYIKSVQDFHANDTVYVIPKEYCLLALFLFIASRIPIVVKEAIHFLLE